MIQSQFNLVSKVIEETSRSQFFDQPITKEDLNYLIELYINLEKAILEKKDTFKNLVYISSKDQYFSDKSIWINEGTCQQLSLTIEPHLSINPKPNYSDLKDPYKCLCEKIDTFFENIMPLIQNSKIVVNESKNCIAILKEDKIIGLLEYNYDDKFKTGNVWMTVYCSNPMDFSLD